MIKSIEQINLKLIEILAPEQGYFGRVFTWGQKPTKYEYIGYKLSEDFLPTLKKMSENQRKNLRIIMVYFEIHAKPLKKLLDVEKEEDDYKYESEVAWSQFMTIIMFGVLEIAVKEKRGNRLNNKLVKIKIFLETYLAKEVKDSIAERYKVEDIFKYEKQIDNFSDVVDHLWYQIRSGFIHDVGIESRGLEWHRLEGFGTKENPIKLKSDVPMQELLQITWQAILNSYGYKGVLKLPRLERVK